ncbi:SMP-30/gluconolactonase/LRE family protein [Nocardia huaxiensis]|uniref:SMP-30/gluconolactonase/LRE family protein n=1 Tax=Nocardia huaxiensis TaxID=2755382 RepID=A0A7D6VN37_9NOCA|nr:SMP-30/gluconolactonase/LRE family protein [Nocardia huaxiensis]QLY33636.1 SMP-30/gluconolactonase/LRE family protein [Nocardia huaxiensis]UFS99448.1 SMP-30/gluconolactonase/LRE family protein [Nocardia huaxiensis]
MSQGSKGFTEARVGNRTRIAAMLGGALLLAATVIGCGAEPDPEANVPAEGTRVSGGPGTVAKPGSLEGFSSPESVLFAEDRWFISNVGAERAPLAKDGDGYLTELNAVGTVTARKAMPRQGDPPLHAPKGMAHHDNRVFVADIDRVVGYDVDTHGQVFEAPLSGDEPAMLNDLALLDSKTLLVSDSLRGIVYRLDLESKSFESLATAIPGANGIALDPSGKVAFVAGTGADFTGGDLWRLDLTQNPVVPQRVGSVHGVLDGIAVPANGTIVISDWVSTTNPDQAGSVQVYNPDGSLSATVRLPDNLRGPADFTLDGTGRNIWVPAMADNRVVVVPLP